MWISRASDRHIINQGKFTIRLISPGKQVRNPQDPYGLGPLGRVDHSTLEPGMVIPMHPHVNDEILSYMRKGQMMHRDSNGHIELLHGEYMMMMNAGKVIYHEETCMDDADQQIEMLQIFFRPEKDDLEPRVQFHKFEFYHSIDQWRLIGGPKGSDAPLEIRSQAWFYDCHLTHDTIASPKLHAKGMAGMLYVFEGSVNIEGTGETLNKGDNLVLMNQQVLITAPQTADLVFFRLNTHAKYSRNGMYAR